MKISFIGTGKAAFSLGRYFQSKGHTIEYCYDSDEEKAKNYAKLLNCKFESLDNLVNNSDLVFITVNDSNIYNLWESLEDKIKNTKSIFLHCSGAKGGIYGDRILYSLHPAAPLTGDGNLDNICFGLENLGDRVIEIKEFITSLGNKVFLIPYSKKREYHLANVIVSNLVLSLFERGLSYLKTCGLNEEDSIALLMPLAKQNLLNIEEKGIINSITGPVSRGDFEVCQSHLEVTQETDTELYVNLSKNILKILKRDENSFFKHTD